MCGLTGFLDHSGQPAALALVKAMTATLAHRGPDGQGFVVDGPVGLGHRRLAVLDVTERAAQPMVSADGRHILIYNGEIYNFRELRAGLEARGYRFRSHGDSEVLLYALMEWQEAAVPRLNGMFAFAFWDGERRRLLLGRDRFGIKPLYWCQTDDVFLFGSEIKALRAHPAGRSGLDAAGLVEYLSFQNFFSSHTLFEGVRLLPPGHTLRVEAGGGLQLTRYWDFDFSERTGAAKEEDLLDELDARVRTAIERQLVSDVPLGAYLSGGIDTGLITALAAPHFDGMKSYTVGFDTHSASGLELACDERQPAELMSYLCQTEHYEMVLKAGDLARALPRLIRHLEEPRMGQSYPNFYAAQLASKFGKVVLSGTGGDELFGGYPWRYRHPAGRVGLADFIDDYFQHWQRLVPPERMPRLLAPVWDRVRDISARALFAGVFPVDRSPPERPQDYINLCLYFEAKTFLHGLLVVEDKLSMANGLEVRVPFLDNDLVDFATGLPVAMKIRRLDNLITLDENLPGSKKLRFFQRTNDGKQLLRKLAARHLPQAIAEADKQGFSAPDASWFRGESIDFVRRTLYDGDPALYTILDRTTVQALVDDHLEGRENRRLLIWSLLCLEQWLQSFPPVSSVSSIAR
jgi:asparagine synthase (glutamine-hydrolysing)